MSATRPPLVLIPQYFGSLVFDRRTSRYLPFDHEATRLLIDLHRDGIDRVLDQFAGDDRDAVVAFYECFSARRFFRPDGRLAAEVRTVDVPADHLVGPL